MRTNYFIIFALDVFFSSLFNSYHEIDLLLHKVEFINSLKSHYINSCLKVIELPTYSLLWKLIFNTEIDCCKIPSSFLEKILNVYDEGFFFFDFLSWISLVLRYFQINFKLKSCIKAGNPILTDIDPTRGSGTVVLVLYHCEFGSDNFQFFSQ